MPIARRTLLAASAAFLVAARAARAGEGGEKGEKKKGGGLSFTQFPTLTATTVRSNGSHGVLTVETGVDVLDPALKARVDLLGPRLRDAYTQTLATFAAALAPGALPDVEALSARLQLATDRVVGRAGAKLLIGTVLVN